MRKKFISNKAMKKALAAMMVASLCMNQMSVGALASEGTKDTVETPAGNVEVTVTTEVTVTDTANDDGTKVQTIVTTDTWDSEPNIVIASDSNATVDVTVTGRQTDTSTVTTDEEGNVDSFSEILTGSEQTEVTTTTTTTSEPEENVLIKDESSEPTTVDEYTVEKTDQTPTTTEGQWENGTPTPDGNWELIDSDPGQWENKDVGTPDTSADGTQDITLADPLDTTDVTLNLTPGTTATPIEEQLVTIEELVAGTVEGITLDADGNPVANTPSTEVIDGNTVTTSYVITKVENGYKVTKNVVTISTDTETGNVFEPTETGNIENKDSTAATPTLSEDLNELLANGTDETNANGENVKTKTESSTNADGDDVSVKTEIREIIENGKVVGYEVTKTTTTTKKDSDTTSSATETTTSAPTISTETFTLPQKPEASDITDATTGTRTVVSVEEVKDANGSVIGYKSTTVITNADGIEVMKSSETVYGTTKTSSSTTTTDPTHETTSTTTTIVETEVTTYTAEELARDVELSSKRTDTITTTEVTDTTSWEIVTTDDGTYFIYQGLMFQVVGGSENGDVSMSSLQPNLGLTPDILNGTISETTDLRTPTNDSTGGSISSGYDFIYTGYGLESAIKTITNYDTGSTTLTHQFKLIDSSGKAHYVLCADLGTTAIRNTSYNMENVETAGYYKREGAAEKIKAIALNGYWGTTSGIGSLEECRKLFRNWLQANGKDTSLADKLTHGEALTATQAAIWNYGNSKESNNLNPYYVAGPEYSGNGTSTEATDQEEKDCTNYFYQALLALNPSEIDDPTTTFITDENFATNSAIVIKDKTDNVAANEDTNPDNDVFKTDVSFTLQLNKDDVSGDLVVHIRDAKNPNNILYTRRISGEGSETRFSDGDIEAYENATTYTFRDIQLSENVTITLNLTGTQNLEQGVYLYSAETYSTSQTFVGVASGTRKVDLNVNLTFNVEEPRATLTTTTEKTGREKVDTETYEQTYTRTDTRVDETEETSYERSATATTQTEVYATLTVTEVTEETTRYEREWESSANGTVPVVVDGDTPVEDPDDDPDDKPEKDKDRDEPSHDKPEDKPETPTETESTPEVLGITYINDDAIPMAVAPKTGERSILWLILSTLSGFGLAGLSFLEKKKNRFKPEI